MNKLWLYIFIGGVFETLWATTMSFSNTFTDLFWTAVTIVILPISVIFLYKALDGGLPTGPSYAVWVGIGAIGAVIVSILMGSVPNLIGFFFLGVLIAGVIGLNLVPGLDVELSAEILSQVYSNPGKELDAPLVEPTLVRNTYSECHFCP